jgi:hypothetical protein
MLIQLLQSMSMPAQIADRPSSYLKLGSWQVLGDAVGGRAEQEVPLPGLQLLVTKADNNDNGDGRRRRRTYGG